jgi:predicted Rossmann-fold nucleotide-binding protein
MKYQTDKSTLFYLVDIVCAGGGPSRLGAGARGAVRGHQGRRGIRIYLIDKRTHTRISINVFINVSIQSMKMKRLYSIDE